MSGTPRDGQWKLSLGDPDLRLKVPEGEETGPLEVRFAGTWELAEGPESATATPGDDGTTLMPFILGGLALLACAFMLIGKRSKKA